MFRNNSPILIWMFFSVGTYINHFCVTTFTLGNYPLPLMLPWLGTNNVCINVCKLNLFLYLEVSKQASM